MRILIITDAYPPEARSSSHLMKEMADGFVARGHEVIVATAHPAAHKGLPDVAQEEGIAVIRAKVLPHHNVNFVMKGISQLLLPYQFFRVIRRHVRGAIDIVFVHSPPLPLAHAAYLVKQRYGATYCLNVQDFFPQNAIDLGVLKNTLLIRFFERMERRAYRACDLIVTPSNGHKRFLVEERHVPAAKINVVYHWIDLAPFEAARRTGKFRTQYGLEGKFVFFFGGIMGPSQGLQMFIEIAAKLARYPDIVFLFVGEGSEYPRLTARVRELGLTNVIFQPMVSKEVYPELVKEMDVGILSLTSANTTPAVPAKLMGYMAAGIPVLAFLHAQSDGISIVHDAECGLATISNNEAEMAVLAERIYREKERLPRYGENALAYARAHFSKDAAVGALERIFRDARTKK